MGISSAGSSTPQTAAAGAQAASRTGTSQYLIGLQEISPGWVGLYAVTLAIQLLCAAVRGVIAYPVLWVMFKILNQPTGMAHTLAWIVGYGPLILSGATLILPLGGWLWQQQSGGRAPSERERLIYDDALERLAQANPGLRAPQRWFVIDEPVLNAAVYANTLMLTRGLIESGLVEPVLAHELGHLNSSDGRLTAALHRLTVPPRGRLRFPLKTLGLIFSGGAGVWVMRVPWAAYWRAREYRADAYAATLGQGQALASFLDTNALENDLPVPFMWFTETSHPYTEHRIDKLHQLE
jgi:Zn-dependent protease with chaperone function